MSAKPLMTLELSSDDEDIMELPVYMRNVLQWEKRYPQRAINLLDEDKLKITYLYEIAHMIAVQKGLFGGKLPEFQEKYDVSAQEEDEAAGELDPTQAEASATG